MTDQYGGVYGGQVGGDRPDGLIGHVDVHRNADAERIAKARRLGLTELDFDQLEVRQTGLDRYSLIDPDGVEYRVVSSDPLQASDLRGHNISAFTIDDNGALLFLRRRDQPVRPASEVVIGGTYAIEVTSR